ncbi:ribonuclease HII [Caniella muris]|uniref:ribonuclease HII n=1 Tax=Caniella muris TaxID=2941502 RepID=UPI0020413548|nr:ribonuclease HII [Caniella muris]
MEPASAVARALREAPLEGLEALIEACSDDPRATVASAVARARRRLERERADRERVAGLYRTMDGLAGGGLAVGVDEVGRGPLAGPLVVGAVVLPPEPMVWGIDDSKRLSPAARERLDARIREVATAVSLVWVPPSDIDAHGMSACLRRAMGEAVSACGVEPDAVLIDGNPVHAHPRERCLVGGDGRVASIACASIVAKVARDRRMVELDAVYPGYGFASNKGYGSASHIAAIRSLGLTPEHRASFCGRFVD